MADTSGAPALLDLLDRGLQLEDPVPAEPTDAHALEALPGPPGLSVPDAVRSLLAAVERANPRWTFHDRRRVRGIDLEEAVEIWPVRLSGGALLGLIVQHPGEPRPEDELIHVLLGALQGLVEAERAKASAERRAARAERAASVDPMTGLANQRAWREALAREEARVVRGRSAAVVAVIDLDGLKEVNDEHGHLAGDILIQQAASTLRSAVRGSDIVARLGGDEFGVLAVDTERESSTRVAGRIRQALAEAEVPASVGAAPAGPDQPLARAVDAADRAMYREKARLARARRAEAGDGDQPDPGVRSDRATDPR